MAPLPAVGLGRAIREGGLGLGRPRAASAGGAEDGVRGAGWEAALCNRLGPRVAAAGRGVLPRPEGTLGIVADEAAAGTSRPRRG